MSTKNNEFQNRWKEYVADPNCINDLDCRTAAYKLAQTLMTRARANIDIIVERLHAMGYRFAFPEAVHIYPLPQIGERLRLLESNGLFIPLSVRAWLEEVGSVNLMGSHPNWPTPAYLFEPGWADSDPWYTDPLVIEDAMIDEAFENWRYRRNLGKLGPCVLELSPDERHKANLSGGAGYEVAIETPSICNILRNERHNVGFVHYLSIAFDWGGFPGFELIPEAPSEFINALKRDLLPLYA